MKYPQLVDGEWVRPKRKGFKEQCCDCGLIHVVDFRIVTGHVEFRATRDARATAAARKNFQIERDED